MPIEPKSIPIHALHSRIGICGKSIMSKSVGLLIATVLAVGLACAPASAQNSDDDDDDGGVWIPILIFSGAVGNTKSPQSLKGDAQNPGRGGLRVHNPGVRLNAAPWPGRRAMAGQVQMMRTRPALYPAGARQVGLGRRF